MRVVPPHIWTWTRATVQWSWGRWCWDFPAAQTKQSSSLTCRLTTRWPISYKHTLTRSLHWWWVWKIRPGRFLFWLCVYFPWSSLFLFGLIIMSLFSFALQEKESSSQQQFLPRMLGSSWVLSTNKGMFLTYQYIYLLTNATIHQML